MHSVKALRSRAKLQLKISRTIKVKVASPPDCRQSHTCPCYNSQTVISTIKGTEAKLLQDLLYLPCMGKCPLSSCWCHEACSKESCSLSIGPWRLEPYGGFVYRRLGVAFKQQGK
ncbi:uncharacterized [Tachysurus ichikawai]